MANSILRNDGEIGGMGGIGGIEGIPIGGIEGMGGMEGIEGMRGVGGIGGMKFDFFIVIRRWSFGGMAVHRDFGVKNGVLGENGRGKRLLG